jgi:integrase
MASLRKKSGRYYARFYDKRRTPKRKETSLQTTRKDVARRRLTRLERRHEKGEFDPWKPDSARGGRLSVVDALERFLESKSHLRTSTLDTYRQQLERWMELHTAPGLLTRRVQPQHLRPYVHDRDVTNATQRKRYRHLRAFLNWTVEQGHRDGSPLDDVRRPKKQKKQAAFLSTEDVEKLLRCISAHYEVTENATGQKPDDEWLSAMIRVAVSTGLRRSELCRLRWADVNLRERLITVRSRDGEATKSGHERQLPLRGDALDVLRDLREGGAYDEAVFTDRDGDPIKPDRATKRFKFFVRKAKLPQRQRLRFHSLRHTAGSWLAMRGVPMRIIQAILGHSSIGVTEQYSHLQPEVMGKAMEEAFGGQSFDGV